jgi:IclR family acetate operon transcriptional repressor
MQVEHISGDYGEFSALHLDKEPTDPKFKSARRIFRIMDLVRHQGEGLSAKKIAHEIGVNLSSCYCLINMLIDEGYVEKVPRCGGYRLGPAIPWLYEGYSRNNIVSCVELVIEELAQRSETHAYLGLLSDGALTIAEVKSPPKPPPVGVAKGFHGASHALSLGKALLAGTDSEGVKEYIDEHRLEAFTPRTITHPVMLETHLSKVRTLGIATDFQEFAENLCCVSTQIKDDSGKVQGAIGLSTTSQRAKTEFPALVELAKWAAEEASALLSENLKARAGKRRARR